MSPRTTLFAFADLQWPLLVNGQTHKNSNKDKDNDKDTRNFICHPRPQLPTIGWPATNKNSSQYFKSRFYTKFQCPCWCLIHKELINFIVFFLIFPIFHYWLSGIYCVINCNWLEFNDRPQNPPPVSFFLRKKCLILVAASD